MIDDITIVIKTFERPDACRRLLDSIRKFYPPMPVVVIDDSEQPLVYRELPEILSKGEIQYIGSRARFTYVHTKFDIGLAAGRNLGITKVYTRYVFTCDDDCEFTEATDLEKAVALLEEEDLDILGIEATGVDYCGVFKVEDDTVRMVRETLREDLLPPPEVKRYHFVPNIFIARTDTLRTRQWDESLKMGEHFAYFFTNHMYLRTGFTDSVSIGHGGMKSSDFYKEHRRRAPDYVKQFMRGAGIRRRIDLQGAEITV